MRTTNFWIADALIKNQMFEGSFARRGRPRPCADTGITPLSSLTNVSPRCATPKLQVMEGAEGQSRYPWSASNAACAASTSYSQSWMTLVASQQGI